MAGEVGRVAVVVEVVEVGEQQGRVAGVDLGPGRLPGLRRRPRRRCAAPAPPPVSSRKFSSSRAVRPLNQRLGEASSQGQVVEAGAGAEAEGHLLADLDAVEAEQVAQGGRAAVVAGGVGVAGDRGHGGILRAGAGVARILRRRWQNADLKTAARDADPRALARASSAAKALGKAGNNGAVWVALGVVLALARSRASREAWLICAALGPIAIGAQLRGQAARPAPAAGAGGPAAARRRPQLAQLPLRPRDLLLRGGDGDDPGRPRRRAGAFVLAAGALARPPLPGHALPLRRPRRRRPRRRPRPDRAALSI